MLHHRSAQLILLLAGFGSALAAYGSDAAVHWRAEAAQVRVLAENDLPRAHAEAQRLLSALPAEAAAADRAQALNLMARIELYLARTDLADTHARQALELARQNADRIGQAEAYLNIAPIAINQARIDALREASSQGLAVLEGVHRPDLLAEAMLRMSMLYRRQSQFNESVTMAMQTMEIAQRSKNPLALTYAHQALGISYNQSGRVAEAGEHFRQMQQQARVARSKLLEASAMLELGGIQARGADHAGGEKLIREAIAIYRTTGGPFYLTRSLFTLAHEFGLQGRPAEALPLLNETISVYERYTNKIGLWWALNARSEQYQLLGRLASARADAERGQALAEEIGLPLYLGESARRMARLAAARGDHRRAYDLSAQAGDLADQAAREKAGTRMLELTERYKDESQRREIEELTRFNERQALQQRWLWTVLGGSLVLLLGSTAFLVRLRRAHRALAGVNRQLQQTQNRQQAILDAIPDVLVEVGLDGHYHSIYHLSRRVGMLVEPVVGKTVAEVLPPEAAQACMAALREAHEAGISTGTQYRLPAIQGERWFELSVARKAVEPGQVPRFVAISRDITERKKMEEALRTREQQFRTLAENAPDNIIRYDRQCRMLYVNPQFETSMEVATQALLGKTPLEAYPGQRYAGYQAKIAAVAATGQPGEIELELPDIGGGVRYHHVRFVAERSVQGEIMGVLALGRDITPLKQAEAEIRALNTHLEERVLQRTQALTESEARFRALLENSPDSIVRFDRACRRLYANPGAARLAGKPAEAMLGTSLDDGQVLLSEQTEKLMAGIRRVFASGKSEHIDLAVVHRDGSTREYDALLVPELDTDGQVATVLNLARDITGRKRMEKALQESEKRYRHSANLLQSVLESSSIVSVYALDREYRFLAFNKRFHAAAKRLWGTDVTIGMSVFDAIDNDVHREFFRKGADPVLTGRSYFLESKEERIQDGQKVCEYHDNYGAPIRNDDGEIVGLTVFAIEVTERKQSEQKLKDALEFTEGVINAIPDLLFEVDRDGRYKNIWTHTPELLAAQKEELLGNTVHDVLSPESAMMIMKALHEADEKGSSFGKVIRIDLPLKPSWFELSVSRKVGHTPPEDSFLVLSRDITGLKQYEAARETALAEAERLARARSEFLAQMSHELRTPLNGILGYAQILQRDKSVGERQRSGLHVIQQSGEHLLTLINDILDFAKIDADKVALDPSDFPLLRFLHTIAEMVRVKAEVKLLTFACDFAPDLPKGIHADEKRLRQILLNLLSNAVKYTDHGQVMFRVRYRPPSRLYFEVRDSGIGIHADRLESIFQPFEQVSDTAHQMGGTGLGLPISRQLVRMMGSDIQVASHFGEGSTFWFELEAPVLHDVADRPAGERMTGYTGPHKKILVVDDVAENRAVLVDMLGQLGFEMIEAANGIECLERAPGLRPDLILMDVVMPQMDGLETTRHLRKLPGFEAMPIIALSASVTPHDQKSCLEAGMNAFLPKPIDMDSLMEQIASFLQFDWLSPQQPTQAAPAPATPPAPPDAELKALHALALQGDIRGILQMLEHLDELGERYRPFAAELRQLARGYQSKAILRFVEQNLERKREP